MKISDCNIHPSAAPKHGFTLVELSIVLVIVGLLAAGILVGRDLIFAAGLRAQIAQIEQYRTASAAFRLKYNALPGDILASEAASYGFVARSGARGHGDNNGIIERCIHYTTAAMSLGCEQVLLWSDLSNANLISGNFPLAADTEIFATNANELKKYFPTPIMLNDTQIMVAADQNLHNWFGIVKFNSVNGTSGASGSNLAVPINIAYPIDLKMDNANPLSGIVQVKSLDAGAYALFGPAILSNSAPTSCVNPAGAYNLTGTASAGIYCHVLVIKMHGGQ